VGTLARQCHDCDSWLNEGAGWIVNLDYPAVDTVIGVLGKILICDQCLVARTRRGTAVKVPVSKASDVLAVHVRGIPRS